MAKPSSTSTFFHCTPVPPGPTATNADQPRPACTPFGRQHLHPALLQDSHRAALTVPTVASVAPDASRSVGRCATCNFSRKKLPFTKDLGISSHSFHSSCRRVLYASGAAQLLATNEVKIRSMKTAPSLASRAGQPSEALVDLRNVRMPDTRIDGWDLRRKPQTGPAALAIHAWHRKKTSQLQQKNISAIDYAKRTFQSAPKS